VLRLLRQHLLVGRDRAAQEAALREVRAQIRHRDPSQRRAGVVAQQQVLVDPDRAADLAPGPIQPSQRQVGDVVARRQPHRRGEHGLGPIQIAVEHGQQRRFQRGAGIPGCARVPPERPREPAHRG
jgi:hypothetical protein